MCAMFISSLIIVIHQPLPADCTASDVEVADSSYLAPGVPHHRPKIYARFPPLPNPTQLTAPTPYPIAHIERT